MVDIELTKFLDSRLYVYFGLSFKLNKPLDSRLYLIFIYESYEYYLFCFSGFIPVRSVGRKFTCSLDSHLSSIFFCSPEVQFPFSSGISPFLSKNFSF